MMNCKMLLKISIFFALLTFISCKSENKKRETIVAQIGDSKLTEAEVDTLLVGKKSHKIKEEIIKNWIETELLYQQAIEKKMLTKENFQGIIKNSEKELAAAISIKNYLKNHPIKYSDQDLKKFYLSKKNDYSFSTNAFILNFASFKTEESAINFRNDAIENKWKASVHHYKKKSDLIKNYSNKIFKPSQIQSERLLRVLSELYKGEISLVIPTELNNYVVVQMIDKIDPSTVPKFDYIKNQVKENYIVYAQRELIKDFLDSLFIEKKVKVY